MYGDDFNWFVGKVIDRISLNKEKDQIDFYFEGGLSKRLGVEGDCCSYSWIEHLEAPGVVKDARILSVDQADMPPWDGHECKERDWDKSDEENEKAGACGHDSLAVYHTRFRTDKGDIVLEYRNDSNGYYGGSLIDEGECA